MCLLACLFVWWQADIAGDGIISYKEWEILCRNNPRILCSMTLPSLNDLTKQYPQFIFNSTAKQRRPFI